MVWTRKSFAPSALIALLVRTVVLGTPNRHCTFRDQTI